MHLMKPPFDVHHAETECVLSNNPYVFSHQMWTLCGQILMIESFDSFWQWLSLCVALIGQYSIGALMMSSKEYRCT